MLFNTNTSKIYAKKVPVITQKFWLRYIKNALGNAKNQIKNWFFRLWHLSAPRTHNGIKLLIIIHYPGILPIYLDFILVGLSKIFEGLRRENDMYYENFLRILVY